MVSLHNDLNDALGRARWAIECSQYEINGIRKWALRREHIKRENSDLYKLMADAIGAPDHELNEWRIIIQPCRNSIYMSDLSLRGWTEEEYKQAIAAVNDWCQNRNAPKEWPQVTGQGWLLSRSIQ